jgi:aminopeptidase 2
MCHSRRADGLSGSTNVTPGREVLPTNVKPVHYDLTLEPDFEKFTYEGTVIVEYANAGRSQICLTRDADENLHQPPCE